MTKKTVLFLCTGNADRSQMAEALLRHHAGETFEALSAGLEPRPVDPLVVLVMAERAIDIRNQTSKGLGQFLGKITANAVVILCEEAENKCPRIWPGALERLYWRVEDPSAATGTEDERVGRFRAARDEIERLILKWLSERPVKV